MYTVYIAYQTVENSTEDALYTVHHGGETDLQSTNHVWWFIAFYLGHFLFSRA